MQVPLVAKRGTNQIHGARYEYYFASDVGAANSWRNDHTPSSGLLYTQLPKAAVNEEVAEQLIRNGFKNVVLMGDHGGGERELAEGAKKLDAKHAAAGRAITISQ